MQDISLHLLDIIENSVRAEATEIKISISANLMRNLLSFEISDNGTGMDEETLKMAQDPFYTSKSERKKKVGLGIPLFKQNAEQCNGYFRIDSFLGKGTVINAAFAYDSIDRMPLGKVGDTILSAIIGHTETDFNLHLERIGFNDTVDFDFDTKAIKEELGDIPINYPDVVMFIEETLKEGIKKTNLEEV